MRIAQITDTHIAVPPVDGAQRERDLARTIAAINALDPLPDLVVHTGDAADRGQPAEYDAVRRLMEMLNVPWVVLPGNRDKQRHMRAAFGDLPWAPVGDGPFDFVLDDLPLKVVAFDTCTGPGHKGWADDDRRAALVAMLEGGKPAVVAMHHPPFEVEEIPDPRQFEKWEQAEALADLLANAGNVAAVITGHIHRHVRGHAGETPILIMPCNATDLRKGPAKELDDKVAYLLHRFDDASGAWLGSDFVVQGAADETLVA